MIWKKTELVWRPGILPQWLVVAGESERHLLLLREFRVWAAEDEIMNEYGNLQFRFGLPGRSRKVPLLAKKFVNNVSFSLPLWGGAQAHCGLAGGWGFTLDHKRLPRFQGETMLDATIKIALHFLYQCGLKDLPAPRLLVSTGEGSLAPVHRTKGVLGGEVSGWNADLDALEEAVKHEVMRPFLERMEKRAKVSQ